MKEEKTKREMTDKLKARSTQQIQRPTQRKPKPKTGNEEAAEFAEAFMKTGGVA